MCGAAQVKTNLLNVLALVAKQIKNCLAIAFDWKLVQIEVYVVFVIALVLMGLFFWLE